MTPSPPLLITGANKRGGLALCRAFSERQQPVIAVYRNDPGALLELPWVQSIQADLACRNSRRQLIDQITEQHRALRGLIHNASCWLEDSLENLATVLAVHVEAPYQLNTELTPLLKQLERADIIHIGDDSACRGTQNHIAYAASKAALHNMTLSFAEQLAPTIRVNTVAPGLLQFKEGSDAAYQRKTLNKALLDFEPGNAPLVEAVLYLLHSTFTTGSTLTLNGGRHLKRSSS